MNATYKEVDYRLAHLKAHFMIRGRDDTTIHYNSYIENIETLRKFMLIAPRHLIASYFITAV